MCTIMTISSDFYKQNKETVIQQIKSDSLINSDSFCLVLFGKSDVKLHTQSIEPILAMLEFTEFNQMFLHCRMATTNYNSLSDSHGWTSRDGWIIFHNGILTSEASNQFRVDSQFIVQLLDNVGIELTTDYLFKHERYANVILMHPESREYRIIRCYTNSLYMDGLGNYSTRPIETISLPMPECTTDMHSTENYSYVSSVNSTVASLWRDSKYDNDNSYSYYSHKYPTNEYGISETEIRLCVNADDFYDLVLDEGWHTDGVPANLWKVFSKTQVQWFNNIQKELKIA